MWNYKCRDNLKFLCISLLIIVHINEILFASDVKLKLFADDTYLKFQHSDPYYVNNLITMELRWINNFPIPDCL